MCGEMDAEVTHCTIIAMAMGSELRVEGEVECGRGVGGEAWNGIFQRFLKRSS